MTEPRGTLDREQLAAAIDSVVADPAFSAGHRAAASVEIPSAASDTGRSSQAAVAPDVHVPDVPRVKTSVPAQVWASALASRKRYHELALIFRPDSYHARTDTADEKRRLAKQILLKAGPAAVDALIDMLVDRNVANADIAELLIQIDNPTAAPVLRQLYETGKFAREPQNISEFIARHLGR